MTRAHANASQPWKSIQMGLHRARDAPALAFTCPLSNWIKSDLQRWQRASALVDTSLPSTWFQTGMAMQFSRACDSGPAKCVLHPAQALRPQGPSDATDVAAHFDISVAKSTIRPRRCVQRIRRTSPLKDDRLIKFKESKIQRFNPTLFSDLH